MARPTEFTNDVVMRNLAVTEGFSAPNGSITNAMLDSSEPIDGSKVQSRIHKQVYQPTGTDVVTTTTKLHLAYAAGEVVALQIRPRLAPTGGDKMYVVDLKKAADGSNTYASVLSFVTTIAAGAADDTIVSATVAGSGAYDEGDEFDLIVTASGATGSQGQGLLIQTVFQEDPS